MHQNQKINRFLKCLICSVPVSTKITTSPKTKLSHCCTCEYKTIVTFTKVNDDVCQNYEFKEVQSY